MQENLNFKQNLYITFKINKCSVLVAVILIEFVIVTAVNYSKVTLILIVIANTFINSN